MPSDQNMRRYEPGDHGYLTRRGFLKVVGAGVAAAGLAAACSAERRALGRKPAEVRRTTYITPNEDFYLVAVDPSFRPTFGTRTVEREWQLTIEGPGGAAVEMSYAEITDLAQRTIDYTFECIGNPVGGTLIGNAEWNAAPMSEVLRGSGLFSSAIRSVYFVGLDDFYSSISVERVMDDSSFLATTMNGEPLPAGHGFPLRTILPDLYGMKQPRWLKRIVLQETPETTSFWEKRGWAGEVPVKTMSRLDPPPRASVDESATITGVAFAGERGIRSVEISLDGGELWVPCSLVTSGEEHVWALWSYEWPKPVSGSHRLRVRATDGTGELQTARQTSTSPDGATGYDTETMSVLSS